MIIWSSYFPITGQATTSDTLTDIVMQTMLMCGLKICLCVHMSIVSILREREGEGEGEGEGEREGDGEGEGGRK